MNLNHEWQVPVPILDDAHLMDVAYLRKLRLLFEDFPKNHNLVLFAQPQLMHKLHLTVHEDIKSRITYSVRVSRLNPDDLKTFLYAQFDLVGLGHNAFSEDAVALIVRSSEGILRRTRNLCLSAMLEAVRDRKQVVGLDQVNRVLLQPHWRKDHDLEPL